MGGVRVEAGAVHSISLELFALLRAADSKQPPKLFILILRVICLYN